MPRTPASSSASACSATCVAYAPTAEVNFTSGVSRHPLDPRLDPGGLQLHPAHRVRQLGEVGLRTDPDHAFGLLERHGPPAAVLDGFDQVLRFAGADVDRGCHLSSSGAAGSIARGLFDHDARGCDGPHVPQLAARGLTKSFGGRKILRGADLDVEAGSRIGVLGPNGGGKSTLLRIIAGLEHADAGGVTFRRGLTLAYLPQIVDGDGRDARATVRAARPELVELEARAARRRGAAEPIPRSPPTSRR